MNPEAFREQLVSYLHRLAEHKGDEVSLTLAQESLEALIQTAIEMKGYTS